jgi:formylglycine-generating enzyme required for sulfatase activity
VAETSNKNTPPKKKKRPAKADKTPRQANLLPFLLAGLVCLSLAFALGAGAWYVFGKKLKPDVAQVVSEPGPAVVANAPAPEATPTPAATPTPTPEVKIQPEQLLPPPPGTVPVNGGQVELGGGEADNPARKVSVDNFYIAETEVTNEQFLEFVKETKHKAPLTWLAGGVMPPNRGAHPVTGVTFQDAVEFCSWLSQKLGTIARLPTEAEWELAARGPQKFLYPWGNEWKKDAAVWAGNGGKLQPVKKLEAGRAPCGAFDMAGNAWEWTSDNALNDKGKPLIANGKFKKILKGGAAEEAQELISATSRSPNVETGAHRLVGFRFVVERRSPATEAKPSATPTVSVQ